MSRGRGGSETFLSLVAILAATAVGGCGGGGGGAPPGPDPAVGSGGRSGNPGGARGGAGGAGSPSASGGSTGSPGAGGGAVPTDGAPSGAGGTGGSPATGSDGGAPPVASSGIAFDPPGGTFKAPQMLTLTDRAGGGTIHYTVDGSVPTKASPTYKGPIMLTESTMVRAFVAGPMGDGPVAAGIYVRLGDDVATFSSNLPVVILHTHGKGALPVVRDGPKVPGSMMMFLPKADGSPQLVGAASVTSRAGMRIRGGSSLRFPQKSYGVELYHPGNDEDDDRALGDWPSSSDYALIGASRADRSLMRNALAFALSNEIGRYAPRTRFVEAYLVDNGGAVTKQNYLGVFTLAEKIKQGKTRVAVAKLEPQDLAAPALTGGYVLRIDQHETHFTAGGLSFNIISPPWAQINVPARQPQRSYIQGYVSEFLEAVGAEGYKHPRTGKHYNEYIDVGGFVDHNILNAVFKNVDGLRFSAYFYKDRGGLLVAGPLWDFDRSSGTRFDDEYGQRAQEPREWARGDGTHFLRWGFWGRLYSDPAFKAAYAQRWATLSKAQLSVENIHKVIDRFAAELQQAQARHFARWPEMPPTGSHAGEVKILKDWFAARVPWMGENL